MMIWLRLVLLNVTVLFSTSTLAKQPSDSALVPPPITCIASDFSAIGGSDWKTITLTLINKCGQTIDFQNSTITFQNSVRLQTNFWGNFHPLSYPDNNLQITSE